jgi:hypothetical protein
MITRALRGIGRACLLALVCLAFPAMPGRAGEATAVHGFGNVAVFDSVAVDRVTFRSSRVLNVVRLGDDEPLRVVGKTVMPGASHYIGALANDGEKLIVLLWDRVEIYDLAAPARPTFLAGFDLGDQGVKSPGGALIERVGEHRFQLLNTVNTSELTLDGDRPDWRVAALAPPDRAQLARMARSRALGDRNGAPVVLRETERFRYELAWTERRAPNEIIHRAYLRKVAKAGGGIVSRLLVGGDSETID